jgi:ankyrin repeat protein
MELYKMNKLTDNNELQKIKDTYLNDYDILSEDLISFNSIENICKDLSGLNKSQHDEILQKAVHENKILYVAMLLRYGGDIHCEDHKKRGLLHKCQSRKMVQLLVNYGINIHQCSAGQHTPLHNITLPEVADELIIQGINPCSINTSGSTPLHYVHNPLTAQLLLKYGVNANAVNYYGHTPLHLVASRGMWEVAYILLTIGNCNIAKVGRDGMSAVIKYSHLIILY